MYKLCVLLLLVTVMVEAQNTDLSEGGLTEREMQYRAFENTFEAFRMKPVTGVEGSVLTDSIAVGDSTAAVLLPAGSVLKSVAVDSLSSGTAEMTFYLVKNGSEYAVTDPYDGSAYTATVNSVPGVYPLKPALFQGITGDSIRVKLDKAQTVGKEVLFRVGGY